MTSTSLASASSTSTTLSFWRIYLWRVLPWRVLSRRVLSSVFEGFAWRVDQYSPQFLKDYPWRVLPWVFSIPCSVVTPSATTMLIESHSLFCVYFLFCLPSMYLISTRRLWFPCTAVKRESESCCRYCVSKNRISHRLIALRKFFPPEQRTFITCWKFPDSSKQCLTCSSLINLEIDLI